MKLKPLSIKILSFLFGHVCDRCGHYQRKACGVHVVGGGCWDEIFQCDSCLNRWEVSR